MNKLSLKNLMKNKKKKGFTLVELIIVIAIIAILVAIAIPKFGQITRNANIKADIATAKNIHGVTAEMIANGDITAPVDTGAKDSEIVKQLDGQTDMPTSKLNKGKFTVKVEANGDVEVFVGTAEVYPKQGSPFDGTTSK